MLLQPILNRMDQHAAALAADRRYGEDRALPPQRLHECRDACLAFPGRDEIELVKHEPAGFFIERLIVPPELFRDRTRIGDRISLAVERSEVDDVQQQARALQVAQEAVPEPR